MNAFFFAVDCYPTTDAEAFGEFSCAGVSCWVRSDICRTLEDAEAFVCGKVAEVGWRPAKVFEGRVVGSEDYADGNQGREFFEQAAVDGFVASFYRRSRELIGEKSVPQEIVAERLMQAVGMLAVDGAFSFYSDRDEQWASGVTDDGDDTLPLWLSAEDASVWGESWPGYEIRQVTSDELRDSALLEEVCEAESLAALSIGGETLVTCHPLWILECLVARSK